MWRSGCKDLRKTSFWRYFVFYPYHKSTHSVHLPVKTLICRASFFFFLNQYLLWDLLTWVYYQCVFPWSNIKLINSTRVVNLSLLLLLYYNYNPKVQNILFSFLLFSKIFLFFLFISRSRVRSPFSQFQWVFFLLLIPNNILYRILLNSDN